MVRNSEDASEDGWGELLPVGLVRFATVGVGTYCYGWRMLWDWWTGIVLWMREWMTWGSIGRSRLWD